MIEVKVPENEKHCCFCMEELDGDANYNILNKYNILDYELVIGSGLTKLFSSEVYLQGGCIVLSTMNALGDPIVNYKRMINYCPICGRKMNVIK